MVVNKDKDRRYKMMEKRIKWKEREGDNQKFYPRMINYTSIIFSQRELDLLNRGLKCNLHYKDKHWKNLWPWNQKQQSVS
jgi:hypothetical protein